MTLLKPLDRVHERTGVEFRRRRCLGRQIAEQAETRRERFDTGPWLAGLDLGRAFRQAGNRRRLSGVGHPAVCGERPARSRVVRERWLEGVESSRQCAAFSHIADRTRDIDLFRGDLVSPVHGGRVDPSHPNRFHHPGDRHADGEIEVCALGPRRLSGRESGPSLRERGGVVVGGIEAIVACQRDRRERRLQALSRRRAGEPQQPIRLGLIQRLQGCRDVSDRTPPQRGMLGRREYFLDGGCALGVARAGLDRLQCRDGRRSRPEIGAAQDGYQGCCERPEHPQRRVRSVHGVLSNWRDEGASEIVVRSSV
jgi:hypothetical protein